MQWKQQQVFAFIKLKFSIQLFCSSHIALMIDGWSLSIVIIMLFNPRLDKHLDMMGKNG